MAGVGALLVLIVIGGLGATVWAIVDLIQRPPEQFPRAIAGKSDKTGWIIGLVVGWILGLGWLVAIVYLIVVRKKMGPVAKGPSTSPPMASPPS